MTWPEPSDPGTVHRMRSAHSHARKALRVYLAEAAREEWGWHGRSLGKPVIAPDGPAWLRVASAPAGPASAIFWNGAVEAERSLPRSIPRPRLRAWHDWDNQDWRYRAELYDHLTDRPASPGPILKHNLGPPKSWWTAMRAMLTNLATVHTDRLAVCQQFLDSAMPRLLGAPIDTTAPAPWTTAHGDFHFANITAPAFHVLDFEGWGLAPAGYDAATLHTFSLLVPAVTERVRRELGPLLDSPAGQYAELAVITERLHALAHSEPSALDEPLRLRAVQILGRPIPRT
jgi:hypothetical protein